MKARLAQLGICLAAIVSTAALSCELSSSLLSESERSSLYTVKLRSGGEVLENGSLLRAGASIATSVARLTGAAEIAALDLELERTAVAQRIEGPSAPALDAAKAAAGEAGAALRVAEIEGELPPLELPADLAPGAYWLRLRLSSAEGRVLQKVSVLVFIGLPAPRIESVSLYPPSIEPGQALLLSAALATSSGGGDPWIRWSRDGVSFAQGLLSEGADRVVWTAPSADGAYPLSVEAFPAPPPAGTSFPFRSAARQELKAMVKAAAGGASDEFADSLAFLSLLRLDGSFEDAGVRARLEAPAPFGSPALDVYPGGFGYALGEEAGVRIPGLAPPALRGEGVAFSLVFRLAARSSSGYLLRFSSAEGSAFLELGLDEGRPYASLAAGEEPSRSVAAAAISAAPHTIVACLRPGAEGTSISWNVDGERIEAPDLPPLPKPPPANALLGGPGSLSGVYDAFGLMGATEPSRPLAPPSYRLASRRRWKGSLALAEGFEEGILPPGASLSGQAGLAYGAVLLEGDAAIAFDAALRLDKACLIEAEVLGDASALSLALDDSSGRRLLSVGASGAVLDGGGARVGSLPQGRLAMLLAPTRGGFLLSPPGGGEAVKLEAEGAMGPFTLSVVGRGIEGRAVLSRILARDAAPPAAR